MRRECRERFSWHRGLTIHGWITARTWRTCRDACQDRCIAVSFEVCGGENVPGIPGACAISNFTYLARGPCQWSNVENKIWANICRESNEYYNITTTKQSKTKPCIYFGTLHVPGNSAAGFCNRIWLSLYSGFTNRIYTWNVIVLGILLV